VNFMYKVFLVEDEFAIRKGIRENIDWEGNGLIFSGEAGDGEQAYALIREIEPDIILTDIRMPFMDGLELSELISSNIPSIKIIILSGFDDFHYAQKAVSIPSVINYILKPINGEKILDILRTTITLIEEERRKIRSSIEMSDRQIENRKLLQESVFGEILKSELKPVELLKLSQSLDINLSARFYVCAVVRKVDTGEENPDKREIQSGIYQNVLSSLFDGRADILVYGKAMEEQVILFKGDSLGSLENRSYDLLNTLISQIKTLSSGSLVISMGGICDRLTDIRKSYREACSISRKSFLFSPNSINDYRSFENMYQQSRQLPLVNSDFLQKLLSYESIEYLDVESSVKKLFLNLKEKEIDASEIDFLYKELLVHLNHYLIESGVDYSIIDDELSLNQRFHYSVPDIKDLYRKATDLISLSFECRNRHQEHYYTDRMEQVILYIQNNSGNKGLSLDEVAAISGMSPCYFSTIFKQYKGSSYIDFLTEVRIGKAIGKLKNTSITISEIAFMVGYNDPHYFSHVFKKRTGFSPSEIRKNLNS